MGRSWAIYLAAGAALTISYVFLHENVLFNIVGLTSPIAILIGIHKHRPAQKLPWLLFAAGQALFVAGDILTYNYPAIFGTDVPFPSLGDPLYLAVYPCLVAGLLLVVRSRMPGRDTGSLIDSLIIAIGAGTISWVLILSPIANASDSTLVQKVIAMAYPLGDLVLLGVVVRLVVGGGRRPPSLYLLAFAALSLLVTDSVYGFISVQGIVYDHSGQLELGWGAFYLLWGAAALHPSMAGLTNATPDREQRLSGFRLAALAGATLLAEIVHAARDAVDGNVTEPILYAVSILMFILVLIRLGGLVQREERRARREKTLREAGASLVSATDRDAVYRATLAAARQLAGPESSVGVLVWVDGMAGFRLVAADGDRAGELVSLSAMTPPNRERLMAHGSLVTHAARAPGPHEPGAIRDAVILPLIVRADLRGLLAVLMPHQPPSPVVSSLETLSVQSALALESTEFAAVLANRRSQEWFAALVQNASDVILVIEPDTTIRFVSPACDRVLGYRPDELMSRPLSAFLQPGELPEFTARLDLLLSAGEATPRGHGVPDPPRRRPLAGRRDAAVEPARGLERSRASSSTSATSASARRSRRSCRTRPSTIR
jgi:PAS domain-containing protein